RLHRRRPLHGRLTLRPGDLGLLPAGAIDRDGLAGVAGAAQADRRIGRDAPVTAGRDVDRPRVGRAAGLVAEAEARGHAAERTDAPRGILLRAQRIAQSADQARRLATARRAVERAAHVDDLALAVHQHDARARGYGDLVAGPDAVTLLQAVGRRADH